MTDHINEGRIRVRDGFSKAWDKVWKEKQTLALIGVLYALILTIAGWGMVSAQIEMLKNAAEGNMDVASNPSAPTAADGLYYIVALLVGAAYYVALTRLYISGRESVLDGGIKALATRSLWVIWRYISAIFIAMLIFMPIMFASIFVIEAIGQSPITGLFAAVLFVAAVIVLMVFGVTLMASVIDTSMDVRTNIRDAFKLLKGVRLRLGGMYILVSLLLLLLAIIGAGVIGALSGTLLGSTVGLIMFMVTIYVLTTFMAYVLIGGVAETMSAIRAQEHVDIEA